MMHCISHVTEFLKTSRPTPMALASPIGTLPYSVERKFAGIACGHVSLAWECIGVGRGTPIHAPPRHRAATCAQSERIQVHG